VILDSSSYFDGLFGTEDPAVAQTILVGARDICPDFVDQPGLITVFLCNQVRPSFHWDEIHLSHWRSIWDFAESSLHSAVFSSLVSRKQTSTTWLAGVRVPVLSSFH
jgi:hypothetical protein